MKHRSFFSPLPEVKTIVLASAGSFLIRSLSLFLIGDV